MLATITDNCDDVLNFLQDVAVKSPRVTAAPLYLCVENHERAWLRRCTDTNLPTPPKLSPQDHMGLTGVLTNAATRLQTSEALRPVVADQREA